MVFTPGGFLEVAIESWSECDLNYENENNRFCNKTQTHNQNG